MSMANYMEKLQKQNEHMLDRMYLLFKIGLQKELMLHDKIDCLQDELLRIKACPGVTDEIIGICDRGLRL